MKRLSALLLGAVLLLSLAACGGGEGAASSGAASSQTGDGSAAEEAVPFTLPVFLDFSLHPVLGANRANLTLSPLLYEGLFQVDESFQAVPVLCERWSASEDLLTWTFTLRAGLSPDHIAVCAACTACRPDLFWSHRRLGGRRGSMAAVIQLV